MKVFLTILFILSYLFSFNQTVIEMRYIEDADVVLNEVSNIDSADIVIYPTTNKACAAHWDCMWLFRNWGFSDFSVYIIKPNEEISTTDTTNIENFINKSVKVYFTKDFNERGYKSNQFHINGVMRINHVKINDDTKIK